MNRNRAERRELLAGRATMLFPKKDGEYWDYKMDQEDAVLAEECSSGSEDPMPPPPRRVAAGAAAAAAPPRKRPRASFPPGGGSDGGGPSAAEQLRERADECDELRQQNDDLAARMEKLVEQHNNEKSNSRYQIEELENERGRLLDERRASEDAAETLKVKLEEAESAKRQSQRAVDELVRGQQDAAARLDVEREKLRVMQQERDALLQGKMAGKFVELENRNAQLSQLVEMLQTQNGDAGRREETLEQRLKDALARADDAQAQLRKAEAERGEDARVRHLLGEASKERDELKLQLADVQGDRDALQGQIRDQAMGYEDKLRQQQRTGAGGIQMAAELRRKEEEALGLKRDHRDARKQLGAQQTLTRHLQKQVDRYKNQVSDMVGQNIYRDLEERLRERENELDMLRNGPDRDTSQELKQVSGQLHTLQQENKRLQRKVADLSKQQQMHEDDRQRHELKEQELKNIMKDKEKLERDLGDAQRTITELLRSSARKA